jgi:hypothetical protein
MSTVMGDHRETLEQRSRGIDFDAATTSTPWRVGVGAGVAQPIRLGPAPAQLQAWPRRHSIT